MKYNLGYIHPPRPELKITPRSISDYDNGRYGAQPKLNGSCGELIITPDKIRAMNRHNGELTKYKLLESEVRGVFGNDINVIIGEHMEKSKLDENNVLFNNKFVVFDQIVYKGEHLLDSTFKERIDLIYSLYNPIDETEFLYKLSDNIFVVKTFYSGFEELYNKLIKIDMFEGLVMKQLSGKLENGTREKNNIRTQLKVRKPTKNYAY